MKKSTLSFATLLASVSIANAEPLSDEVQRKILVDAIGARSIAMGGNTNMARQYCDRVKATAAKYEPEPFMAGVVEECFGYVALWEHNPTVACAQYTKAAQQYRLAASHDYPGEDGARKKQRAESYLKTATEMMHTKAGCK